MKEGQVGQSRSLTSVEQQLAAAVKAKDEVQNENERLLADLEILEELRSQVEDIPNLKNQIGRKDTDLAALREKLDTAELASKQISALQNEARRRDQIHAVLNEKLRGAEKVSSQLTALREDIEEKDLEISAMKRRLNAMEKDSKQVLILQNAMSQMDEELIALREKVEVSEKISQEVTAWKQAATRKDHELATLRKKVEAVDTLSEQVVSLQTVASQREQELFELNEKIQFAEIISTQATNLQGELQEKNQALALLQEEVSNGKRGSKRVEDTLRRSGLFGPEEVLSQETVYILEQRLAALNVDASSRLLSSHKRLSEAGPAAPNRPKRKANRNGSNAPRVEVVEDSQEKASSKTITRESRIEEMIHRTQNVNETFSRGHPLKRLSHAQNDAPSQATSCIPESQPRLSPVRASSQIQSNTEPSISSSPSTLSDLGSIFTPTPLKEEKRRKSKTSKKGSIAAENRKENIPQANSPAKTSNDPKSGSSRPAFRISQYTANKPMGNSLSDKPEPPLMRKVTNLKSTNPSISSNSKTYSKAGSSRSYGMGNLEATPPTVGTGASDIHKESVLPPLADRSGSGANVLLATKARPRGILKDSASSASAKRQFEASDVPHTPSNVQNKRLKFSVKPPDISPKKALNTTSEYFSSTASSATPTATPTPLVPSGGRQSGVPSRPAQAGAIRTRQSGRRKSQGELLLFTIGRLD